MYKIENVSIASLIEALESDLMLAQDDDEVEELSFALSRLDSAAEGSRLVQSEDLDLARSEGFSVQEGFWEINGRAWYLCEKI